MLERFAAIGVEVLVCSANSKALAEKAVEEWKVDKLRVGYGVTREDAARWGLFVSGKIKDNEPEYFLEPGLFVIRPDGELYASVAQTMPFSRPSGEQALSSLTWIVENEYPARGELALG